MRPTAQSGGRFCPPCGPIHAGFAACGAMVLPGAVDPIGRRMRRGHRAARHSTIGAPPGEAPPGGVLGSMTPRHACATTHLQPPRLPYPTRQAPAGRTLGTKPQQVRPVRTMASTAQPRHWTARCCERADPAPGAGPGLSAGRAPQGHGMLRPCRRANPSRARMPRSPTSPRSTHGSTLPGGVCGLRCGPGRPPAPRTRQPWPAPLDRAGAASARCARGEALCARGRGATRSSSIGLRGTNAAQYTSWKRPITTSSAGRSPPSGAPPS